MDVCIVGGVPGRLHQGAVAVGDLRFHVTRHQFKRFADFTTPARDALIVDRAGLEAFVDEASRFDAILCESPEAVVLAWEWRRRGARPRAVIAMEIQRLRRVHALRRWYGDVEGADPWPVTAAAPWIAWHVMSPALALPLVAAGVPDVRVRHVPSSTALLRMLLPDADALLDGGADADGPAGDGLPSGAVLVPGSGARDRATVLRAAALLPDVPLAVVDEFALRHRERLAAEGLPPPPSVTFLAPVALERYIALVRRAAVIVVPLDGEEGGGHTTVTLAQRLARPIVVSDVPAIADFVEDGVTARLVPPGDPAALAAAVRALWDDAALRARLGAAACAVERERATRTWAGVEAVLEQALRGAEAFAGW